MSDLNSKLKLGVVKNNPLCFPIHLKQCNGEASFKIL